MSGKLGQRAQDLSGTGLVMKIMFPEMRRVSRLPGRLLAS
jgi:hypothetical protein